MFRIFNLKPRFENFHIFFIIIIAIFAQIYFLQPPILSDQLNYFYNASNFPLMTKSPNHQILRLGLIFPTHLLIKVFGYSELSYYFIPFLSEIAFVVFIYFLGRRFLSPNIAFLSSIITPFFPYLLRYTGYLLPDGPSVTFFLLSMLLLFHLEDTYIYKNERFKVGTFFLIGIIFGYSYLIREFILLFSPIILFFFWIFKKPFRYLIVVIGGFLVILLAEMIFNNFVYGDALIRFATSKPRETIGNIQKDFIKVLFALPNSLLKYNGLGYFLLLPLSLISIFNTLKTKNKNLFFLSLWFIWVYSSLTIIGLLPILLNWDDKVLLRLNLFRYWFMIIPPLVILGLDGLEKLIRFFFLKKTIFYTKAIMITFGLVSIFFSFSSAYGDPRFIRWGNDHFIEFRHYIKENCTYPRLWLEKDNFRALNRVIPIYLKNFWGKNICEIEINYFNNGNEYLDNDQLTTGIVPIHTTYMNYKNNDIPQYFMSKPSNWQEVFKSSDKKLVIYEINNTN